MTNQVEWVHSALVSGTVAEEAKQGYFIRQVGGGGDVNYYDNYYSTKLFYFLLST